MGKLIGPLLRKTTSDCRMILILSHQRIRNRNVGLAHYNRSSFQIFLSLFIFRMIYFILWIFCTFAPSFHSRYGDNCGRINLSCFVEKYKPNFQQQHFYENPFHHFYFLYFVRNVIIMLVRHFEFNSAIKLNYVKLKTHTMAARSVNYVTTSQSNRSIRRRRGQFLCWDEHIG